MKSCSASTKENVPEKSTRSVSVPVNVSTVRNRSRLPSCSMLSCPAVLPFAHVLSWLRNFDVSHPPSNDSVSSVSEVDCTGVATRFSDCNTGLVAASRSVRSPRSCAVRGCAFSRREMSSYNEGSDATRNGYPPPGRWMFPFGRMITQSLKVSDQNSFSLILCSLKYIWPFMRKRYCVWRPEASSVRVGETSGAGGVVSSPGGGTVSAFALKSREG